MRPAAVAMGFVLCAGPAAAATLVVQIQGIDPGQGVVKLAVCDRSFDAAGCRHVASRAAKAPVEEFVFDDLAPGRYAVAAYHDLNGNGQLDTSMLGLPTEPYGFSNDVGRERRPEIGPALVNVDQGRTTAVVRVHPFRSSP
ncbi:MAG: DUF2141 domain-containing protein [Geminicoccaceae bacterium]